MMAAHIHRTAIPAKPKRKDTRPNAKRRKRAAPIASTVNPAGYFCELIQKHNWPPRFESHGWKSAVNSNGMTPGEQVSAQIEQGRQDGRYFAIGTIGGINTPKNSAPRGWIR